MKDIYKHLLEQGFTKTDIRSGCLVYADFGGMDFSRRDFSNLKLVDVNLQGANFNNANFKKCNFTRANFSNTDFSKADFGNVNFTYAEFNKTIFDGAYFTEASFHAANFLAVKFREVSFYFTIFRSVFMAEIDFSHAVFTNSCFSYTDFSHSYMVGIKTGMANFTGNIFNGNHFKGVYVSRTSKIDSYVAISGSYDYQTFAFKLSSGAKLIRLGCFCRTVQSWDKDFWNNNSKYDKYNENSKERLFAFVTLKKWLEL